MSALLGHATSAERTSGFKYSFRLQVLQLFGDLIIDLFDVQNKTIQLDKAYDETGVISSVSTHQFGDMNSFLALLNEVNASQRRRDQMFRQVRTEQSLAQCLEGVQNAAAMYTSLSSSAFPTKRHSDRR